MPNQAPTRRQRTTVRNKNLSSLCTELTQLFNQPLPATIYGVRIRKLLGAVRTFGCANLRCEDKVRIDGSHVVLDLEYVSRTYDPSDERRRADAILFVLHELVHLIAQGIGAKETVRKLRRAGGETSLLHADLCADHIAAALLHRLAPQWSLAFLRDVQSMSLTSFPSTDRHTAAARRRKRMRMLALRADFWARRLGLISDRAADGYIYLEHGQGSRRFGDLSVLLQGPPVAVLGTARLGTKEAAALERVTAPSKPLPLSRLDDLLVHALRRLSTPVQHLRPADPPRAALR